MFSSLIEHVSYSQSTNNFNCNDIINTPTQRRMSEENIEGYSTINGHVRNDEILFNEFKTIQGELLKKQEKKYIPIQFVFNLDETGWFGEERKQNNKYVITEEIEKTQYIKQNNQQ